MKELTLLISLVFLFTGCGGSSDDSGSGVTGIPFLSVSSALLVDDTNQTAFNFSGECRALDKVSVSGPVTFDVECSQGNWQKEQDLSYLPNGIYRLTVVAGEQDLEVELKKNTLRSDALALYEFQDVGDLGRDSNGNYNAQSIQDVTSVNDSEKGLVAQFNGASSFVTLSDGSFLNDEFSTKSFIFYFKTPDLTTSQMLFEEGGSGNGLAVKVGNSALTMATRAGGVSTQTEVSVDVTGLENTWIKVIASFNKGELKLSANDNAQSVNALYTLIPSHGDAGGLGDEISSSAFSGETINPFQGLISDFRVYEKVLSEDEIVLLAGENPEVKESDSLSFGRNILYDFENSSNLGNNSIDGNPSGVAQNVTQFMDQEQGNAASFNGSNSSIQINNGTFWNKSFSVKAYALYFKSSDVITEQVLFEEGGSTNGVSLRIENGYLFADAVAGNSAPRQTLIEDIIDLEDQWVKVVVQFDKGTFRMTVVGKGTSVSRNTSFTTIPDHSSDGGLGIRLGGDASGRSGAAPFLGLISKFSTYGRVLSDKEIELY